MEPYHPSGYRISKPDPTPDNPHPEYILKFRPGEKRVPDELVHGKEVEVQIDDRFQIFGHYRDPILTFDNSELDINDLLGHKPKNITIWY